MKSRRFRIPLSFHEHFPNKDLDHWCCSKPNDHSLFGNTAYSEVRFVPCVNEAASLNSGVMRARRQKIAMVVRVRSCILADGRFECDERGFGKTEMEEGDG